MHLTFETTVDEHKAWSLYAARSAISRPGALRPARLQAAVTVAIFLIVSWGIAVFLDLTLGLVSAVVTVPATAIAVFHNITPLALLRTSRAQLDRYYEDNPPITGPTTVEIDDTGIAEHLGGFVHRANWTTVRRIIETDQHVFIDFGGSAFVIPSEAFESSPDRHEALVQIERRSSAPWVREDFTLPRPAALRTRWWAWFLLAVIVLLLAGSFLFLPGSA